MARGFRSSRVVSRGPRRQTDWNFSATLGGFSLVPAASKLLTFIFPTATIEPFTPFTIVRTRGII